MVMSNDLMRRISRQYNVDWKNNKGSRLNTIFNYRDGKTNRIYVSNLDGKSAVLGDDGEDIKVPERKKDLLKSLKSAEISIYRMLKKEDVLYFLRDGELIYECVDGDREVLYGRLEKMERIGLVRKDDANGIRLSLLADAVPVHLRKKRKKN